jgi:signal transduction histidine kinase
MTTDAELDVNILVVDDLAQNLLAMEALLARPGVRVIKASSGLEALELLLLHEVAVALLDVQMPEMDGFELAELIRGRDSTRHIPLMFVTAAAADQQRQFQGYDYGAVDFLHKPVESHVLISKVNVFIELYRQQRHIRLQNARLSETLQLNEMFVAVLAHDLRVPLTAMSLGVRLLRDAVSTPPASALLDRVEGSAARMGRMIEQLLDLSRIRSGQLTLALRSQDLAALAEQAVHELDPTNSGRLTLTVMGNTQARVDLDRWQQVLTNLLGNALTHGHAGSPIKVTLDGRTPHMVVLEVSNRGTIASEKLPELFQPFKPCPNAPLKPRPKGLGLGLYIVHQFVRAHEGTIDVQCSAQDDTTTFVVRLPRSPLNDKPQAMGTVGAPLVAQSESACR